MMNSLTITLAVILLIALAFTVRGFFKSKRPVMAVLKSALSGLIALGLLYTTAGFTGLQIGINAFTLAISSILGIPGAALVAAISFL